MSVEKKITIAIDGYSSCGKSTLAKAMAQSLEYVFIDSGAMYRGVTLFAQQNGFVQNGQLNSLGLIQELKHISISFGVPNENGISPLLLNNLDVSKEIRSLAVSDWVSEVAQLKEVRQKLVREQQKMGEKGGVIMDGRDIGSVVFPNAELKLFITASPEIRTERRYAEMMAKGETVTKEEIRNNLAHRDLLDSTRTESPLIQTDDAIVIDNTHLNQTEQLEFALNLVNEKLHSNV